MSEALGAHWATIRAGNIVIASGYCWCDRAEGGQHAIGVRPTYPTTEQERER